MTLADWRKKAGLSLRGAAALISEKGGGSLTGEFVRQLEAGGLPSLPMADVIKRGTGGAVTRMDWPETKPEGTAKRRSGT